MVPRHLRSPLSLLVVACIAGLAACGSDAPPTLKVHSFEVAPGQLQEAGDVTIRWVTSGAAALALLQGDQEIDLGERQIKEDSITLRLEETTTFTLSANDAKGKTVTASRTVVVELPPGPQIAELIAADVVQADEAGEALVTIAWAGVQRAAALRLEAAGQAAIELDPELAEGSVEVTLREDTTFTLIASNEHGSFSLHASVRVAQLPVIEDFDADRHLVGYGEMARLEWTTTDATRVELWQDGVRLEEAADTPEGGHEATFYIDSTLELRAFNELDAMATATLDVKVGAPEIVTFGPSSPSIWLGESVSLGWQTKGGSELAVLVDQTGETICEESGTSSLETSSCTWQPSIPGFYTLTLSLSNLSGLITSTAEIFVGAGPFIAHLGASPEIFTAGDTLEISWRVLPDPAGNEPTLELKDDRNNVYSTQALEGRLSFTLLEPGPYEFVLEATTDHPDASPDRASVSVLVHPRPGMEFSPTPAHFDDSIDDEVVLNWTTEDAEAVVLYQLVEGSPVEVLTATDPERAAGSYSFVPREDRSYRLVATNTIGGSTSQDVEVTVAPTEILSFNASPDSFTQGQEIRLSWVSRMVDELTIDVGTKRYLLEETDAPYLELELEGLGGARLPMTNACGAIASSGCAPIEFPDGFVFPFGGDDHHEAWIYTPGYLALTDGERPDALSLNGTFPTDPKDAAISLAPFWESLSWDPLRYPTGNVYTALLEEAGERTFVIQWRDIGHEDLSWRTASFNFQVVLREDGSFDFRYGFQRAQDSSIPFDVLAGSSATIGFQLPDQSDFGVIAFNGLPPTNGSREQRTFSYRPLTALPPIGELVLSPLGRDPDFPITLTATRDGVSYSKTVDLSVARKPILELIPEQIAPAALGAEFRLGWSSRNATSLVVVDGAGVTRCHAADQSQVDDGLCALHEDIPGVHPYTVRATGANDFVVEREISVHVFGNFGVASFTSDADAIEKGEDVLLRWEVFEAASVILYAGEIELFSDPSGASVGSFLVEDLEEETHFKLVVTNQIGSTSEASLTVGLLDLVFGLQASATHVYPGDPVTITVDARTLDGGAPVRVYGLLPLAEVPGTEHRYSDISGLSEAKELGVRPTMSDSTIDIDLPADFSFPYMGETYTRLRAFLDGYVSLNPTTSFTTLNSEIPTTRTPQTASVNFAPFWDDLHPRNVGKMHSALIDADTFVIQWSKMSLNSGSSNAAPQDLNFQLVLFRDGAFEYRYGTMAHHATNQSTACYPGNCSNEVKGASATIGYQYGQGTAGYNYHFGGTNNAAGNPVVDGGLGGRTLRYPVIEGSGSFTFYPQQSNTYSICAETSTTPACKEFRIEAEFGLRSAQFSKTEIEIGEVITLSWQSEGGRSLRVLNGEEVIYTTSDLAEIAQGSTILEPTENTSYVVELRAGNRKETILRLIEVSRFALTAEATASSGPGGAATLSWNLTTTNPGLDLHIAAPMEEISNQDFDDFDISNEADVALLIGANSDSTNATLPFVDFTFPYFGTEHSSIRVATDGYLNWETSNSSSAANMPIPNTTGTHHAKAIAPFWENLHTRLNGKVIAKKIDADRYVIQWINVSLTSGSSNNNEGRLNFLVVLHRNGSFEFRYSSMRPPPLPASSTACFPASCERETNGSSATIGYQTPGGSAGHQLHFGGTQLALAQNPVPGGLSDRAWRFTPRRTAGPGSVQVHPANSSRYTICVFSPNSSETVCAPTLGIDVPWGIDLFQFAPTEPLAGEPVTLSWSAQGLDSLRILANEVELVSFYPPGLPLLGTHTHTPSGTTVYRLEARSMDRIVIAERRVALKTFDLEVNGPSEVAFPGDTVVIDWKLTPHASGDVAMLTPMSEIPIEQMQEAAFIDISDIQNAEKVQPSGSRGSAPIPLHFPFPYLGASQTSLQVFVNGYLSFAPPGASNGSNTIFPTSAGTSAQVHLAPFWDDLVLRGGESIWHYAPDANTLIVQWKGFSHMAGTTRGGRYDLNFQVVLRADGSFDYRYGEMKAPPPPFAHRACYPSSCLNEANGSSATIGYQSVDAQFGSTLHAGSLVISPVVQDDEDYEDEEHTSGGYFPFQGGLSHRSFRYTPTLSGSARVVVGSTPADHLVCGILGDFGSCKSVRIAGAVSAGELMITEMMVDPAAGVSGQWFEVRNLSSRSIDMQGLVLRSNQGSHPIDSPLPIPSGGFVTLASSAAVPFTPSYVYGGEVPLNRLLDSLAIVGGATIITEASWGIDWAVPPNQALSLDPSLHLTGLQSSSEFEHWCRAGTGGSPGSLGDGCLNSSYDLDPLSDRPFIDIASTGIRFHAIEGQGLLGRLPPTGFRTRFFGEEYSRLWVASNGWVSLSDTLPTTSPATISRNPPRAESYVNSLKGPLIAPFWDVLLCGDACRVYYERREVAGQDVLIIQWENFHLGAGSTGSMTFQLQLWENGDLVFSFQVDNPYLAGDPFWAPYEGSHAWIGLESADPTVYLTAHFRERPLGLDRRSIHFKSTP